jgi:hypothetical protein
MCVNLHLWLRQTDALFIAVFYAVNDEGTQEGKVQCYQIPLWHNKIHTWGPVRHQQTNAGLKIIVDFLNWCCVYFTWPLFYQINQFRLPTVTALISLIMQLIAAHKTRLFLATHYQLIYMNFCFVCLTSGHVSKVIRGYFSKPEGVRKQNR